MTHELDLTTSDLWLAMLLAFHHLLVVPQSYGNTLRLAPIWINITPKGYITNISAATPWIVFILNELKQ